MSNKIKPLILDYSIYIFIFTILYSFITIFFGLDFFDSFFHLNISNTPDEYFSFLSSILNNFFIKITSGKVYLLRIINFLLIYSPFLFFVKLVENKKLYYLLSACVIIIITPYNFNILGYDTYTIFFSIVLFYGVIKYYSNQNLKSLFGLIICSILVFYIRFPNIVVVFFVSFLLTFFNKKEHTIKHVLLYFLVSIILIGTSFFLLEYSELIAYKNLNLDNHRISILLSHYFNDFIKIIVYACFMYILYYLYYIFPKQKSNLIKYLSIVLILGLITFMTIIQFKYGSLNQLSLLISSSIFLFFIINFKTIFKKFTYKSNFYLIAYLLFSFIIIAGTNTGLLRLVNFLPVLPFAIVNIATPLNKKIIYFSLPLLVVLSLGFKTLWTYQDSSLWKLNHTNKIEKLQFIHTTQLRSSFLNKINQLKLEYEKEGYKILFYGGKSAIFNYTYDTNPVWEDYFLNPMKDLSFFDSILSYIEEEKTAIFFIDSYPNANKKITESILIKKLESHNFKIKIIDGFYVLKNY